MNKIKEFYTLDTKELSTQDAQTVAIYIHELFATEDSALVAEIITCWRSGHNCLEQSNFEASNILIGIFEV